MRFYVKGQTLTRSGREIVATEAVNYPNVEIEFDSSWDGVGGRTAVFQNVDSILNATTALGEDNTAYGMLLTEGEDGIWRTHVPYEVLHYWGTTPPKFIVTVYGGSVNSKRITTNSVTIETVYSFYDEGESPGEPTPSQWDQVVDLLEDIEDNVELIPDLVTDVGELQNDVSDLETEVSDARIDTNDTTWPSLGQAFRGQITGLKNYMQYSGFLAEITTQEGKKWQAGADNTVELVDASDNTTSAISAKILYQPTGCYIRMRNVNHSGQFTEWWGLGSEEKVYQDYTDPYMSAPLVNNTFVFNKLVRGIVEIRFNSDTEKIAAAQVICSNETYGYQYDEVVSDTKSIKWIIDHGCTETLLGTAQAQRWQTEFSISPALNFGDLLHITGSTNGDLPMSMKIYESGTSHEQKFYDSQSSEYNIDIYVYVNGSGYDTFRVWSKYGNAYDLRVYKVSFDQRINDLTDVNITNPSNGQVLTYDSATSKWKNQSPIAYSDTEQIVGTAFGATVYEKTYLFTSSVAPNATITLDANLGSGTVSWVWLQNISLKDTSGDTYATENIRGIGTTVVANSSGLQLTNNSGITILMGIVTVRYIYVT